MDSQKDYFLKIFNSIDFHKIIDHPNILVAANFWNQERFRAAKTCYQFMRKQPAAGRTDCDHSKIQDSALAVGSICKINDL